MAATLNINGDAYPVMIRDLSCWGAQVEGTLTPHIGAEVTLSRGPLNVQAHMTWTKKRRCGLRFASPISIQDWMANPVNRQQHRVDRVVAAVKSGAPSPGTPADRPVTTPALTAQDLRQVSRLIEIVGDSLANDPTVVVTHGINLQNLDIAVQTLTTIAGLMQSDDPTCAVHIGRLEELRVSCAAALRGSV